MLFILIQLLSTVLTVIGWFLLAPLAAGRVWHEDPDGKYHWPGMYWVWDNEEDGICAKWYCDPIDRWHAYVWSAWRNSANNMRYICGVSDTTRPLSKWKWSSFNVPLYLQFGWNDSGFPVISGGRNVNG